MGKKFIWLLLLLLEQNLSASNVLRLSFVGDLMAHDSNYQMQDFSRIYARIVPLLQNSDLNFANLEFVIDSQRPYSTYPVFNVHPEYVQAAIGAGFNVFSLANNHSADFGLAGIRATEQSSYQLQRRHRGLTFSGLRAAGRAPESFAIESIHIKGWHIGFTAISMLTNSSQGIAALQYLSPDDARGLQKFYRQLAEQRANYDLVIVSVHGGLEYKLRAGARRKNILRQIARAGADVVWGHHPHVQQAWEIWQISGSQRNWALIMYSQGNFISAQTIRTAPTEPYGFWAATGDSVMLQLEVGRAANRQSRGQLELRRLRPVLLSTIRLRPFAFAVVPMADAAAEMRAQGYSSWDSFYTQRQTWLKKRVAEWPVK